MVFKWFGTKYDQFILRPLKGPSMMPRMFTGITELFNGNKEVKVQFNIQASNVE